MYTTSETPGINTKSSLSSRLIIIGGGGRYGKLGGIGIDYYPQYFYTPIGEFNNVELGKDYGWKNKNYLRYNETNTPADISPRLAWLLDRSNK